MNKLKSRHIAFACLGVILCLAGSLLAVVAPWQTPQYDPKTFCPLSNQYARTAILIDATDSLSEVQVKTILESIDELRRRLQLHEWLGVFLVGEDNILLPEPVIALCNPGDESAANPLYQNPGLFRRRFEEQFNRPIKDAVEKLKNLPEQSASPIMEMVAAVALNAHFDSTQKRRLIVVSDMLQNVGEYSQYGAPIGSGEYYDDWKRSNYAQVMVRPGLLRDVAVDLLYVKREKYRNLQTHGHILFWTRYFTDLGGALDNVKPI